MPYHRLPPVIHSQNTGQTNRPDPKPTPKKDPTPPLQAAHQTNSKTDEACRGMLAITAVKTPQEEQKPYGYVNRLWTSGLGWMSGLASYRPSIEALGTGGAFAKIVEDSSSTTPKLSQNIGLSEEAKKNVLVRPLNAVVESVGGFIDSFPKAVSVGVSALKELGISETLKVAKSASSAEPAGATHHPPHEKWKNASDDACKKFEHLKNTYIRLCLHHRVRSGLSFETFVERKTALAKQPPTEMLADIVTLTKVKKEDRAKNVMYQTLQGPLQAYKQSCISLNGVFTPDEVLKKARKGLDELKKNQQNFDALVNLAKNRRMDDLKRHLETRLCRFMPNGHKWGLIEFQVLETLVSKFALLGLDRYKLEHQGEQAIQNIAYLAAAYQEGNRLKTPLEYHAGEDFLRIKVAQLNFLYEDVRTFSWSLTFVDDEENTGKNVRSIDQIRSIVDATAAMKGHVHCLDVAKDLREELAQYTDPAIRAMDPNAFSRTSVKGGAIHLGMRYLARTAGEHKEYRTPVVSDILMTDCDTSVNLANSGLLLSERYCREDTKPEIVIGSRRIKGAHVIGKSESRQLQSLGFNLLMRTMLNLQCADTQVGCKLFSTDIIGKIHSRFTELSMAFDAEMLKLVDIEAKNSKVPTPSAEVPIVWVDSEMESKSAQQGKNMGMGLWNIRSRLYENTRRSGPTTLLELGDAMKSEAGFDQVLELAKDPLWSFVTGHFKELYDLVTPGAFRDFVNSLWKFLEDAAENKLDEEVIDNMMAASVALIKHLQNAKSAILPLFLEKFSKVFDACQILQTNPSYYKILGPLLFGDFKLPGMPPMDSFSRFIQNHKGIEKESNSSIFGRWLQEMVEAKPVLPKREELQGNDRRISEGIVRLRSLAAAQHGPKKKLGIVMAFDSSITKDEYLKNILEEKMGALKKLEFKKLQWKIMLMDTAKTPSTRVNAVLKETGDSTVTIVYKSVEDEKPGPNKFQAVGQGPNDHYRAHKFQAIRQGLTALCKDYHRDIVAFIDISDKINLLEISHLVSDILESKTPMVSFGSRRMPESKDVNKGVPQLAQSLGLSVVRQAMFPSLSDIYDSNTGFKCFSRTAWKLIMEEHPQCNGLGGDVELLLLARQTNCTLRERPVDFRDSHQDLMARQEMGHGIFHDLLRIRNLHKEDPVVEALCGSEVRSIGAGAENAVFQYGSSFGKTLVKIPYETLDPDLYGVITDLIFPESEGLSLETANARLINNGSFKSLLDLVGSGNIAHLREWGDLNQFIMKMITSWERKDYKSTGYKCSAQYGDGLICPFREVEESFEIKHRTTIKVIPAHAGVKETMLATDVFQDRLKSSLECVPDDEMRVPLCKKAINEGIGLFRAMWKRGLVDLDTNLMRDTGYVSDAKEGDRLMLLDPGEVMADLANVNPERLKAELLNRADFIELSALLDDYLPNQKREVVAHYELKFNEFYDFIKKDANVSKETREFGKDLRTPDMDKDHYRVKFETKGLPKPTSTTYLTLKQQQHANRMAGAGVQSKFTEDDKPVPMAHPSRECTYRHYTNKEGVSRLRDSNSVEVPVGSILPTLDQMERDRTLASNNQAGHIVVLNAGSGTRSGLPGQSEPNKGFLTVGGIPLFSAVAAGMEPLSKALGADYVILAAGDDVLECNAKCISNVTDYFKDTSRGFYFFDLPEAGKDFVPYTLDDFVTFLEGSVAQNFLKNVMGEIPFLRGFVEANRGDQIAFGLAKAAIKLAIDECRNPKGSADNRDTTGGGEGLRNTHGIGLVKSVYEKFLHYNAAIKGKGMKTPSTMVFKKDYLRRFKESVATLIPSSAVHDITWESVLIRGLKCDPTIWQVSRPSGIEARPWRNIYEVIQKDFKSGIDFSDRAQCEQRVFRGKWQNFDDPVALFEYAMTKFAGEAGNKDSIQMVCDGAQLPNVKTDLWARVAVVNSTIEGEIEIVQRDGKKQILKTESLFYNLHLPAGQTLVVPPNHVVVTIKDKIYSMEMGMVSKDRLKTQPVYEYGDDGNPRPVGSYDDFMDFMRMKKTPVAKLDTA